MIFMLKMGGNCNYRDVTALIVPDTQANNALQCCVANCVCFMLLKLSMKMFIIIRRMTELHRFNNHFSI